MRLIDAAVAAAILLLPAQHAREEAVDAAGKLFDVFHRVDGVCAVAAQEAFATPGVVKISQLIAQAAFTDFQAEMLPGDVLHRVRFIQNHRIVFWKIIDPRRPQRQIGEKQRVIDDQNLPALHAPFGRLPKALVVELAFLPQAIPMLRAHLVPHISIRQDRQIGQRSVRGLAGPVQHHVQRIHLPVELEQ